jgi:hypothetical protein
VITALVQGNQAPNRQTQLGGLVSIGRKGVGAGQEIAMGPDGLALHAEESLLLHAAGVSDCLPEKASQQALPTPWLQFGLAP